MPMVQHLTEAYERGYCGGHYAGRRRGVTVPSEWWIGCPLTLLRVRTGREK
jgi:hypothetical protein